MPCVSANVHSRLTTLFRETNDMIAVFDGEDDKYHIPKSEIKFTSGNVLIDLPMYDIAKRYKISRKEPLPTGKSTKIHGQG
jgi:hypothetical protein